MSGKLGVVLVVLAILVGSMGLKTALSGGHQSNGTVLTANGPEPVPTPRKSNLKALNGPEPVPTPRKSFKALNGPEPVPTPRKSSALNGPEPVPTPRKS